MSEPRYLIWSNQKTMWWRAEERGYTQYIEEAGRYPLAEAEKVVAGATVDGKLVHPRTDPVTGRAYDGLDEWVVLAPGSGRTAAQAQRPPAFAAWLRERRREDSPVGDLARDWVSAADPGRRRGAAPRDVRDELDVHNAADGAYEALDAAARRWQAAAGLPVVGMPRFDPEEDDL